MERIHLAQGKYKWQTFVNRLNEISDYEWFQASSVR
jgi:hypothetical protein